MSGKRLWTAMAVATALASVAAAPVGAQSNTLEIGRAHV